MAGLVRLVGRSLSSNSTGLPNLLLGVCRHSDCTRLGSGFHSASVDGAGVAAEVMLVDEVDGAEVRPVSQALPLSTRTAATVTTRILIMAALYRAMTLQCVFYGRPKSIRPMASVRGSPTSIVMVTVTASTRRLPHMLQ